MNLLDKATRLRLEFLCAFLDHHHLTGDLRQPVGPVGAAQWYLEHLEEDPAVGSWPATAPGVGPSTTDPALQSILDTLTTPTITSTAGLTGIERIID